MVEATINTALACAASPDRGAPRSLPQAALIYGLGASGTAAARLLLSRGVRVWGYDDRPIDRQTLAQQGLAELRLLEADSPPPPIDVLVLSPGVRTDRPWVAWAHEQGIAVVAEVELAFSLLDRELDQVVAITGSNGKSTTTAMTGALLQAAGHRVEVCGNIGEPMSSKVAGPAGRAFVVELSSFQLESVDTFRPKVAALLNLAADHLDRHGDFATYAEIKSRIFRRQRAGDVAVLNADDHQVLQAAVPNGVRKRYFSRRATVDDGCFLSDDRVLEAAPDCATRELFRLDDVPVPGPHNLENAMAAALIASTLASPTANASDRSGLIEGLRTFRGLPHRLELVRQRRGVAWYDDSKGTNVAATLRSVSSFDDGSVHLILGGRNKGADLSELADLVAQKARTAYLIGESATELEAALSGLVDYRLSGSLERAVQEAAGRARPGETVLLSPACASFDQFENFIARGRAFARLVAALPEDADG